MRTTFFTCCNKKYEDFLPIFLHSILYHNNDVDVEIGLEDFDQTEEMNNAIQYIRDHYPNSKIKIVKAYFGPQNIENKIYNSCANVIRFIETPTIKNDFVYICDIDIITLQKNIQQIHIDDMNKTGLNYSNKVRLSNDPIKRLTGLHFSKWDNYYPIPDYQDLIIKGLFGHDEAFLYELVKKRNKVSEETIFRPIHGIHISPNRVDPVEWGLKKWKKEWIEYRNSGEFLYLEKLFTPKITNYITTIDQYYNQIENKFTNIYLNNHWKGSESKSGPGSTVEKNKLLLKNLEEFVVKFNISSIIDCGCGDFNWMQHFNFNLIKSYLGIDIVKPLIDDNTAKFSNKIIKFKHINPIDDSIEFADVILCKDVLVHLCFEDAFHVLENVRKSKSTYFISTTFYNFENKDIKTGQWRPINLESSPFYLGAPIILWKNIENKDKEWIDKSIGVWKIN